MPSRPQAFEMSTLFRRLNTSCSVTCIIDNILSFELWKYTDEGSWWSKSDTLALDKDLGSKCAYTAENYQEKVKKYAHPSKGVLYG